MAWDICVDSLKFNADTNGLLKEFRLPHIVRQTTHPPLPMSSQRNPPKTGFSKLVWELIYRLAHLLPAKTKRQRKARAAYLATKIQENADRHGPLAAAVAVNGVLIALGGLITVRHSLSTGDQDAIEVSLNDGFLTKDEAPAPPSGGSTAASQAALDQAMQQMLTTPAATASDLTAVTTVAPAPVAFEVKAAAPTGPSAATLQALNQATATAAGNASNGTATGSQSGTGTIGRQGEGGGTGTLTGLGSGTWDSKSRNAQGNVGAGWARPGKDALENQKIVLIYDQTQRFAGDTQNYPEIEGIKNTIIRNNQLLGQIDVLSGLIAKERRKGDEDYKFDLKPAQNPEIGAPSHDGYSAGKGFVWLSPSQHGTVKIAGDYANTYWAILEACEKYAGQKATLVVFSDFVEGTRNYDDVEFLAKALIKAELRLYLITTEKVPAAPAYALARQTGGDVRRVYSKSYSAILNGNYEGTLQWADPESKNLLRNLDQAPQP